jgi:hypothetical protein
MNVVAGGIKPDADQESSSEAYQRMLTARSQDGDDAPGLEQDPEREEQTDD